MKAVVRVLFGNIVKNSKYRREVLGAIRGQARRTWMRDNAYHFVSGEDNYKLLKAHKVKNIELVNKNRFIKAPKKDMVNIYYNKVHLMRLAMEQFDEILFADFDATPVRMPDDKMWNILNFKKGKFNGDFQTLNVGYKRPICLSRQNGGIRKVGRDPLRHGLNTSVLYCRDKTWLEEWEEAYLSSTDIFKGTGTDEHILMHYLDCKYGVFTPEEMVDNFEIEVAALERTIPIIREKGKLKENVYFRHY